MATDSFIIKINAYHTKANWPNYYVPTIATEDQL